MLRAVCDEDWERTPLEARVDWAELLDALLRRSHALGGGEKHVFARPTLGSNEATPPMYREDTTFRNVRLRATDGAEFPVHKLIVCSASAYFKALLAGGMKEDGEAVVAVSLPARLLGPVIEFIYAANDAEAAVAVSPGNASELLGAANMLQMRSLVECCAAEVASHVDATNVLEVLELARENNAASLEGFCYGFALRSLPAEGALRVLGRGEEASTALRGLVGAEHALGAMWDAAFGPAGCWAGPG